MRRTIQITITDSVYIALCDDGSLWAMKVNSWARIPDIPQDHPEIKSEPIADEPQKTWHENLGLYGPAIDP